ncbi:DUF167 domain-containing protein [Spirosoma utsteinense]|uniref:UPF0235 protein FH603_4101 n=1 Tax=Spirosoma utsteinense TaxID=2585773 RepID=A0ABR6WAJ1_9BACT|nr:DUF167 domain-containing protein [Spirosoma utsteinense]MBC3783839.1 hypothetical protein [Spirosoma utsteinense]MBC3793582.1 hypothetical protein [Spirosoma utsteinense]
MTLYVKVKPGSKADLLFYDAAGKLTVKIRAPAQDGKANAYLMAFLAATFGIAKSSVTIVTGFTNAHKRIEVDADEAAIETFLNTLR